MNNLSKFLTTFGSAFLLAALLSAVAYNSDASARSITIESNDGNNNIRIYHEKTDDNRVYQVNGRKFYWKDLTPQQQQRIKLVEAKIKKVESRLQAKEKEMQPMMEALEAKARMIEEEMQKLELATVKIEKPELNLADIEKLMEKLEAAAEVNEKLVEVTENEMGALEHQIEAIDMSFSDELEQHVEELEMVLVAIAAEMN